VFDEEDRDYVSSRPEAVKRVERDCEGGR